MNNELKLSIVEIDIDDQDVAPKSDKEKGWECVQNPMDPVACLYASGCHNNQ